MTCIAAYGQLKKLVVFRVAAVGDYFLNFYLFRFRQESRKKLQSLLLENVFVELRPPQYLVQFSDRCPGHQNSPPRNRHVKGLAGYGTWENYGANNYASIDNGPEFIHRGATTREFQVSTPALRLSCLSLP